MISISVVIPLYNKAPYVVQAVRSVLASHYPPHEVIVVDDGSSDSGPARVRAIGDPRLRLVSQANRGVSAARNLGIDQARGDYIAFLDADDVWMPQYLAAIVELIARFPGCGMYGAHFYYFRDDGFRQVPHLKGLKAGAQIIERFFELWARSALFNTSAVVLPRRLLDAEAIRFPVGEQHGEDLDVWFRIAERWPLAYLPEALVGYRLGTPGSLSDSFAGDALPCMQRLAARSHAIAPQHRKGVSLLLSSTQLAVARHLLAKGQRARAIRLLYEPGGLRFPRFWMRLFLAAHTPGALGRQLLP